MDMLRDHVFEADDGRLMCRFHRTASPLDAPEAYVAATANALPSGADVILLGAGGGTMLHALLNAETIHPIWVWDRDPAILVSLLERIDLAAAISEGRLRLLLGVDLVPLITQPHPTHTILHPLLAQVYKAETHAWVNKAQAPWVAVRAGGLFCDDLHYALREKGFNPWPVDMERIALEEIDHTLATLKPKFVASINYVDGMEALSQVHGCPILSWEIDPSLTPVFAPSASTEDTHLFMFRRSLCAQFSQAGFQNVSYLPLAANPLKRRPLELTPEEKARYGAQVSFVGQSLATEANNNHNQFMAAYGQWSGEPDAIQDCAVKLHDVLHTQRQDVTQYLLPELLEEHFGPFLAHWRKTYTHLDPVTVIAEVAAMEKRMTVLASLRQYNPAVWGDAGWENLREHGAQYMGFAGHSEELTRVYNGSDINIDVGRIYQNDMPPMRVFDVMACGAFVLAEHNPLLEELFDVGVEVQSWTSITDLLAKVEYYTARPKERKALAQRGMEAVLERHTISHRLDTMLRQAGIESK